MRSHSARKWGIVLVFVFALTLLSLGIMFTFRDRDTIIQGNFGSTLSFSEQSIPVSFSVSSSYKTPPFTNNSDTWSTSFASILEASYRYFGVQTNFISHNQYVRFSPHSIKNAIQSYCSTSTSKLCTDLDNLVAADFPLVSQKKDLIPQLALPIDFCQDNTCTNSQIAAAGNPVNFEIINYKHAITTNDIKHLLYTEEKPLVLTIKKPYIAYEFNCSDHRVAGNKECNLPTNLENQSNIENESIIYNNNNTSYYITAATIPSAEYVLPKTPAKLILGEPETFLIYGYNDEHVSSFEMPADYPFKRSIGGFICKKSTELYGNQQTYLMGKEPRISNINSCMSNSPLFWKGADVIFVDEFIRNNTINEKDFESYVNPYSEDNIDLNDFNVNEDDINTTFYESIYLQNPTILKCINSSICDPQYNYSIASFESKPLIIKEDNGFTFYYLFKWCETNITNSTMPELFKLDTISSLEINKVFQPITKIAATTSGCAYWFIPYDLIDEEMRLEFNSEIHAISIDFEWKKESYACTKEQNYEKIIRSTFQY